MAVTTQTLRDSGVYDTDIKIYDSELVWTTSYDAAGNTIKSTDPDTGTTISSYDDDNELVSSTDNGGQALSTDYDVLGRKTAVHNGNTSGPVLNAWSYDTADAGKGQLATATTYAADGATPTWSHSIGGYNAFGKPTGETTAVPAGAYGNTAAISYATTTSYSPVMGLPNMTTIKETGTGNLIGTETYGIGYNETGLPVSTGGLATYVTWANYDPHGRLIRATDSVMPKQMVVTNSWDEPTGRLLNATVSKEDGTAAVDSTTYTYNPAGQVTSATDTQDGGVATDRQCFDYDYLGRLTNAWTDAGTTHTAPTPSVQGVGGCDTIDASTASLSGPAPYWQSYSYDLTGNRLSSTDHATTPGGTDHTTTETYDGLDTQHAVHTVTTGNSTTSWDYDADGRPTDTTTSTGGTANPDTSQTFTWNPAGKLATLTTGTPDQPTHSTSYGYDADGNLIARTVDGTTTVYLGADAIHLSGGSATEIDRTYSFPGGPTAVRVAAAGGSSLHWQAADPHGTGTVDITATDLTVTRRLYTPFGQDRTLTSSQGWAGDKGFVGGTRDNTNQLTNLGAREYSATLGRFLNPDPDLDQADPQALNNYAYADNGPINKTDPNGERLACTADIPCGPIDSHHPYGRCSGDSRYTGPNPTIGYDHGHIMYVGSGCHGYFAHGRCYSTVALPQGHDSTKTYDATNANWAVVLAAFLDGLGGSFNFKDGDPFAEQVRQDDYLQQIYAQIAAAIVGGHKPGGANKSYYHPMIPGIGQGGYDALSPGQNMTVKELGSYHVEWSLDSKSGNKAQVTLHISNKLSNSSIMHIGGDKGRLHDYLTNSLSPRPAVATNITLTTSITLSPHVLAPGPFLAGSEGEPHVRTLGGRRVHRVRISGRG